MLNQGTTASLYKTKMCRYYLNGECRFGDDCVFAHGTEELRSGTTHPLRKTKKCSAFHSRETKGICYHGSSCNFIHREPEAPIAIT